MRASCSSPTPATAPSARASTIRSMAVKSSIPAQRRSAPRADVDGPFRARSEHFSFQREFVITQRFITGTGFRLPPIGTAGSKTVVWIPPHGPVVEHLRIEGQQAELACFLEVFVGLDGDPVMAMSQPYACA